MQGLRRGALRVAVIGVLALAGCGDDDDGSPTGPTPPAQFPPIPVGFASVDISAGDAECTARTSGWGLFGPRVSTGATITRDGDAWVARPASQLFTNFEIRFTASAVSSTEATITGTFRGTMTDLLSSLQFPNPSRATSGAKDAALRATYRAPVTGVFGQVTGAIVFTDIQGQVTTCQRGLWSLFWRP